MAIGTILVIDDDRLLLQIVGDMIRRAGFQAEVASDPREGLARARQGGISLILLDVVMPELNGFQVLKQLKENAVTSPIPVVMLTSKDEIHSFSEAHDLGVEDYINKPFEEPFLIKRIYRVLFRSKTASARRRAAGGGRRAAASDRQPAPGGAAAESAPASGTSTSEAPAGGAAAGGSAGNSDSGE